ncbi:sensor histidine kinase [Bradyrhizobium prioriisuperbiae]|uniref:sensor histidine kinase n=1 Tax=Bradyrhizobium prioriisuperbiae TaxID=2854389 RepID=UPI0028ECEE25|nr:CHASE3 domain-containing protein [Bradyrhizobium prioritasuperba]
MRQRTIWQIALLSAGFAILIAIGATSLYLLNVARNEAAWVVHTIEAENQISRVLLDLRSAESAARGYLLTQNRQFLDDYERGAAEVIPATDTLARLTTDNPIQIRNTADLRAAAEARLKELQTSIDLIKRNDLAAAMDMIRNSGPPATVNLIGDISNRMQREEDRLLALRGETASRSRSLSTVVTLAGAALIVLLGGLSIYLVRQSSRERDQADQRLRDNNLNLEAMVDERTVDLREANEEIQRFAYIVSHDLRSPLVNIMGFTSELEELRSDIFNRIAKLHDAQAGAPPTAEPHQPVLADEDKKLADDFSEALGFIKSSIGKMDRLIAAILNLTREGRREFRPESLDMQELVKGIGATVAHQALEAEAHIEVEQLPGVFGDRLAMEQIFSNLIDNALKYLTPGVPGQIVVRGRRKLGFAIFEVSDNGRGIDPKDHQRIFELFRRAGTQDRPGQGIGLAHVRALVRRLGGSMSVDSELNNGSTFIVTLPLNQIKEGRRS